MDLLERNWALRQLAIDYTHALRELLGESLTAVVLFGSTARGEATPVSDVDLLVIARDLPKGRLARQEAVSRADDLLAPRLEELRKQEVLTDFSPLLKTPEEAEHLTPLYLDLVEDAVILFDREGFFSAILSRLRNSLDRLGARRVKRGRVRYWELKPDYVPGETFEL